jgi:ABC-2 type transport system ATP-binding protein
VRPTLGAQGTQLTALSSGPGALDSSASLERRLRAEALTVARGRRVLLRGLYLNVHAGDIVHIAGENGCGKSSLLRVLSGDVAPRAGRVERPRGCAYVPERMVLPEALPARRWLRLLGAAHAPLPPELERRCGALSKGQLQRVALIGALATNPPLIILDEPWAGLDREARGRLDAELQHAARAGAAVIFTDHSGAGAVTATRRLVLGSGEPRHEAGAAVASPQTARIVLTRGDERRTSQVGLSDRDDVLRRALADGWGVERVEPDA